MFWKHIKINICIQNIVLQISSQTAVLNNSTNVCEKKDQNFAYYSLDWKQDWRKISSSEALWTSFLFFIIYFHGAVPNHLLRMNRGFRSSCSSFRWKNEDYELVLCEKVETVKPIWYNARYRNSKQRIEI